MNIAELKNMPVGTKISEFTLLIRTARGTSTDSDGSSWQDVVFIDGSGELQGRIQIESESHRWKSKTNICIMEAELQDTDHRGKEQNHLVVFRCFDSCIKLSHDIYDGMVQEQWNENNQDIIKSKIRCWLVAAHIQSGKPIATQELFKQGINNLVDYVMTGE